MALTTTSTLAIRAADDATASPFYKGPAIQTIAQINSESRQVVVTIAFANTAGVIQAANNVSVTLTELEAYEASAGTAYDTLMDAIEQHVKTNIEALTENADATITFTGRK